MLSLAYGGAPSTVDSASSVQMQIHACYQTKGVGICLQSVLDKQKSENSDAWATLSHGLGGVANRKEILDELTAGRKAWQESAAHDCKAAGLLNSKDSPAYGNDLTACLVGRYASESAFYRSLDVQPSDASEKKLLEEYRRRKGR